MKCEIPWNFPWNFPCNLQHDFPCFSYTIKRKMERQKERWKDRKKDGGRQTERRKERKKERGVWDFTFHTSGFNLRSLTFTIFSHIDLFLFKSIFFATFRVFISRYKKEQVCMVIYLSMEISYFIQL